MTTTAAPPRRAHRRLRLADGAGRLRLMALAGIATVLITRAYLAATGYPRIGGGGIHIGHVVWGGLLMIAALTVALVWAGERARVWTALLGGVGIGLFVDEVGKYLTTTNDYFYRPAAAIIYLVFAALLVVASLLGRDTVADAGDVGTRLAGAAQIAAGGLVSGLTSDERGRAARLLDGCPAQDSAAVLRLLDLARVREPSVLARVIACIRRWAYRVAELRWSETVAYAILILSRVIVAIIFVAQAATETPHSEDNVSITASAITRSVSAVLVVAALALRLWGRKLASYQLAKTSLLLDLLVTEIFNFHDSQFGATTELPQLLVGFAFFSIRQRQAGQEPE
ncbi:hypothetical protein KGQ19_34140 [Catenulispora sp. NL8]|uniref:Integral membrane protein n=1 Tax=Catenulispora pinistramenti TaxID=2705254 RepID=A0ABS5L0Q4_9ACTN|nr:hypothetical protein [Catenulispora pinistramenti]MBS2551917.1 hypothetical protein [Catenulispora pinistramenti]